MSHASASAPIVLVPIGTDEDALDHCLAALDASTPAATPVWLADNAQAGPRSRAVIDRWLQHTPLQAEYTRRPHAIAEAAHVDQALRACADADVVVLASDARPVPGWLGQLRACLAQDAAIASVTPWSNAGETVAWPRLGEVVALDYTPQQLATACQRMPVQAFDLPAAVAHAVLLRGSARVAAGGLDAASFRSWHAALIDLSMRQSGLGGRSVLCSTTFVLREREAVPEEGDMDRLVARWPVWNARIAGCLMDDPLRDVRQQLHTALLVSDALPRQADLFTRGE